MILNWENLNRYRRYPFVEDANLKDTTEALELPNDFLIAFTASHYDSAASTITLRTIDVAVGGTSLTATFLINGSIPVPVIIPAGATYPFNTEYVIQSGSFSTTRVTPIFGPGVDVILANATFHGNLYTFDTPIEPSLVASPYKHAVTKLIAKNIDINDNEIILPDVGEGDVKFINGFNSAISSNGVDSLTFKAIKGAGEGEPCDPYYDLVDCSCAIFFINGKHPDWLGNFIFEAGKFMKVENDPDNFKVKIKTSVRNGTPKCQDPAEDPGRLPPPEPPCEPEPLPGDLPVDLCDNE
jgi:hypothetical protein